MESGASINTVDRVEGITPLHYALRFHGDTKLYLIEKLLKNGADVTVMYEIFHYTWRNFLNSY